MSDGDEIKWNSLKNELFEGAKIVPVSIGMLAIMFVMVGIAIAPTFPEWLSAFYSDSGRVRIFMPFLLGSLLTMVFVSLMKNSLGIGVLSMLFAVIFWGMDWLFY